MFHGDQATKQYIGIWGYATAGKAAAAHAQKYLGPVVVFDHNVKQQYYDTSHQVWWAPESDIVHWPLAYLIPSPGIDINQHPDKKHVCKAEYDIYAEATTAYTIGITGSVGKTTITALVTEVLSANGVSVSCGGNIGRALCDMAHDNSSYHVLELSSFQLEHITSAAPHIAVITNFYPNHLDRHGSVDAYWHAKSQILRYQPTHGIAVIPLHMLADVRAICPGTTLYTWAYNQQEKENYEHLLSAHDVVYVLSGYSVYRYNKEHVTYICHIPHTVTYTANWLIIATLCDIIGVSVPHHITIPDTHRQHRQHYIGTYRDIACYDDSKATVMPATHAAVKSLASASVTLLLGGISKGVTRSKAIADLADHVAHIVCFGHEANHLYQVCRQHGISASLTWSLHDAVKHAFAHTPSNGVILLSPGGASFDQFASYQERGRYFQHLVATYHSLRHSTEKSLHCPNSIL